MILRIWIVLIGLFGSVFGLRAQADSLNPLTRIVMLEGNQELEGVAIQSMSDPLVGLTWKSISKSQNVYLVSWSDESQTERVLKELDALPGLIHHHSDGNVVLRNDFLPNDPSFTEQWWLTRIKADQAWRQSTGGLTALGDTIVIAVLERQGPDFGHEDLQDGLFWVNRAEIPGNGIDDDNNGYIDDYRGVSVRTKTDTHSNDSDMHCTPVSAIIGANTDNGRGMSAINWNIKLLVISDVILISQIIEAYEYVLQMRRRYHESGGLEGALIVGTNASFGRDTSFPEDFPIWCSMYDALGEYGILTAAAAPNRNVNIDVEGDLPALCPSPYIIAVTSTTEGDIKTPGAGFGEQNVDLGAPGEEVLTALPGDAYSLWSGTSAAAPMVSGAIALLYAMPSEELARGILENPAETGLIVKNAILNGVDKLRSLENRVTTGGRLNIGNSMAELAKAYGRDPEGIIVEQLYPNPVVNELTYVFNSSDFNTNHDVLVFNMLGQQVLMDKQLPSVFGQNRYKLDVSTLASGPYILTIRDGKKVASAAFVKSE